MWYELDILIKPLGEKNNWTNLPSDRPIHSQLLEQLKNMPDENEIILDSNGFEVSLKEHIDTQLALAS